MPRPNDPATPTDRCHTVSKACCVSALPTAPPRQLFALIALAIAVGIGTTQLPLVRRGPILGDGRRPAPST
jgi:hypothetical protein